MWNKLLWNLTYFLFHPHSLPSNHGSEEREVDIKYMIDNCHWCNYNWLISLGWIPIDSNFVLWNWMIRVQNCVPTGPDRLWSIITEYIRILRHGRITEEDKLGRSRREKYIFFSSLFWFLRSTKIKIKIHIAGRNEKGTFDLWMLYLKCYIW